MDGKSDLQSASSRVATMTTIPARLAKAAQVSHSLPHAQSRARALYRTFYRAVSTRFALLTPSTGPGDLRAVPLGCAASAAACQNPHYV